MINGFIEDYSDFTENCYKIKNKSVCNSCWNKVVFDKNYNTCVFKEIESERFQCSKSITRSYPSSKGMQINIGCGPDAVSSHE